MAGPERREETYSAYRIMQTFSFTVPAYHIPVKYSPTADKQDFLILFTALKELFIDFYIAASSPHSGDHYPCVQVAL